MTPSGPGGPGHQLTALPDHLRALHRFAWAVRVLLAVAFLLCWDWHRLEALWGPERLPVGVQG